MRYCHRPETGDPAEMGVPCYDTGMLAADSGTGSRFRWGRFALVAAGSVAGLALLTFVLSGAPGRRLSLPERWDRDVTAAQAAASPEVSQSTRAALYRTMAKDSLGTMYDVYAGFGTQDVRGQLASDWFSTMQAILDGDNTGLALNAAVTCKDLRAAAQVTGHVPVCRAGG